MCEKFSHAWSLFTDDSQTERRIGGENSAAHEVPVSLGFLPALAPAAKLDMRNEGRGAALARFDPVRERARNVSGRFRTNTIPIEAVNVSLWRASSRWTHRDDHGFARRVNGSGGDWQIFGPTQPQDGYGNWGLTEENGGVVMSTTALVFAAGVYPLMFADFANLIHALTAASEQLQRGVQGTSTPLLAGPFQQLLRTPITTQIPKELCMEARRLSDGVGGHDPKDRWGDAWCDFYKSVSWNLPGAGTFVFNFAKGLLGLEFPLFHSGGRVAVGALPPPTSAVFVRVYGTDVVATRPGGISPPTQVPLPPWSKSRWPRELRANGTAILVAGLNLQGQPHNLSCTVVATHSKLPPLTPSSLACSLVKAHVDVARQKLVKA